MNDEVETEVEAPSAEDVANWKRKLAEVEAFMATGAYKHGYLPTYKQDILDIELNILNTVPTTPEVLSHVLLLHGQRAELQRALTFFESSQAALKDQIAAAEDAQTEVPDNEDTDKTKDE